MIFLLAIPGIIAVSALFVSPFVLLGWGIVKIIAEAKESR